MNKSERKRIYYIPGIISLTILPILFVLFAKKEIRLKDVNAIPIMWTDTSYLNNLHRKFEFTIELYPPKRNYTDILFTGDDHRNDKSLAFAQTRIREILSQQDTINGLHFIFDDSSTYGMLVKTIDILRFEKAKTYIPSDNNLWFYCIYSDTSIKPLPYNCLLCDDVVTLQTRISWWTKTKKQLKVSWDSSWQIIVLYTCFLISIFLLRQKKQQQKNVWLL